MVWFEGAVSEAVAKSKDEKAIFIVYLHHKLSEKQGETERFEAFWSQIDLGFFEVPYVAIRVEIGSTYFAQFASIYKHPVVPSTYFIGQDGKVIDIISLIEEIDGDIFINRITKAFDTFAGKNGYKSSVGASMTHEQKNEHVKQLVDKALALKQQKDLAESHQKEIDRINDGKKAAEAKEAFREKELKETAASLKRQKDEDKAYKKRLLDQMELEKRERQIDEERRKGIYTQPKKTPTAATVAVASDRCQIQLRYPDGKTAVKEFDSTTSLQALYDIVVSEKTFEGEFSIVSAFPRKEFVDLEKNFLDYQLTPRSCILVVPVQSAPAETKTTDIKKPEDESLVRQRTNIRSLPKDGNASSDDERTETWNGNSTTQL
uniref:UBX domain-containing protein n=1 Tax=Rhabditophanes sp. KR3021 TaxID=114890 RepID=A0AC35TY19_9BILA